MEVEQRVKQVSKALDLLPLFCFHALTNLWKRKDSKRNHNDKKNNSNYAGSKLIGRKCGCISKETHEISSSIANVVTKRQHCGKDGKLTAHRH